MDKGNTMTSLYRAIEIIRSLTAELKEINDRAGLCVRGSFSAPPDLSDDLGDETWDRPAPVFTDEERLEFAERARDIRNSARRGI